MKQPLKNIIISFPLVWSIRNFILSNITEELSKEFNIYFATPPVGKQYFIGIGIPESKIIILENTKKSRYHSFIFKILKEAFSLRYPIPENDVFTLKTKNRKKTILKMKDFVFKILGHTFKNNLLYRSLCYVENRLYIKLISNSLKEHIDAINPVLAVSTAFVVEWEWSLFRLLHKKQIPVWTHILSFDNLTSRSFIPINFFDKYLVWNNRMKQELAKYYDITEHKIDIVGTPQFDFHLIDPQNYDNDIEIFWKEISNNGFILYCANHLHLTPKEPQLLEKILLRLRKENLNSVKKVILRLHPMDDFARWDDLLEAFPEVILNTPWKQSNSDAKYWGSPTLQDLHLFSYLLQSASVILHVASTVSIDAAIANTPIVCLGFHPEDTLENIKYHDYHFTNHYRAIIDSEAVALAQDMDSLIYHVNEAIENPALRELSRKKLANYYCNDLTALSKEKILKLVKQYADQ